MMRLPDAYSLLTIYSVTPETDPPQCRVSVIGKLQCGESQAQDSHSCASTPSSRAMPVVHMFPLLRVASAVIGAAGVSRLPHRTEISARLSKPSGLALVVRGLRRGMRAPRPC